MPEAYEVQLVFWRWVRPKKKKKNAEQYVMLFPLPAIPLSSVPPPSLPGIALITSWSSITGRKRTDEHQHLQCTLEDTCMQTHLSLLCVSGGPPQVHVTLSLFSPTTCMHTYRACMSSKQWVETASSRSLQEKEGAAEVARWLLQRCT